MDILIAIVALVPSTLSVCVSGIYAYIALKKSKEPPKDEIWETATKILCSSNTSQSLSADEFAFLYEELKFFKENGYSMKDINTLSFAVREKHKQEQQQSQSDSTS